MTDCSHVWPEWELVFEWRDGVTVPTGDRVRICGLCGRAEVEWADE